MLSYIKKYPVSLFIILAVIYLSFFKPPSTEISKIPNIDKRSEERRVGKECLE